MRAREEPTPGSVLDARMLLATLPAEAQVAADLSMSLGAVLELRSREFDNEPSQRSIALVWAIGTRELDDAAIALAMAGFRRDWAIGPGGIPLIHWAWIFSEDVVRQVRASR